MPFRISKDFVFKTFRVMNWTVALLLAGFLQVSAAGFSQSKITLSLKNAPLEKVFAAIESQSGYTFWYEDALLKNIKPIDIDVRDQSLEQTLVICCKDLPLDFSIVGNLVAIKEKKIKDNPPPDKFVIKGRVINEKGEVLPGASISVKGTNKGVFADASGLFEIHDIVSGTVLVISFTGYFKQEIKIRGEQFLSLVLVVNTSKLDETIIIGYGHTTQKFNTGSASVITSEEISKQPVTNPLEAMESRAPGLFITQSSGLPGSAFNVKIRGQNSIAASNNPLYVVDGVPFTSTPVEIFGGPNNSGTPAGYGSPLNSIPPSEIESITILKDADATSIFGSRGSNGVVLITTKKGKAGKPRLDINLNTGIGTLTRLSPTLGTPDYLPLRYAAFANDSITPTPSNAPDLLVWDTTKNTNWQKQIYGGTSRTVDMNAGFSGGNSDVKYLISGNYHHEGTVYPTEDGYRRIGAHMNINYESPDKKFSIAATSFYTTDNNQISATSGELRNVAVLPPDFPGYDSLGHPYWSGGIFPQPLADLNKKYKSQTENLNANIIGSYQVVPGLYLKLSTGYNKIDIDQISISPTTALNPAFNQKGSSNFGNQYVQTSLLEPQINWSTQISRGKLELLGGGTFQQTITDGTFSLIGNYSSDLLLESQSDGTVLYKTSTHINYEYVSLFARLNYIWSNKYILNASFRRDGSSRFGPGYQYGNFGSLGLAWLFSEEPFIKDRFPWLSYGKLRGSYGTTGNDGIPDYGYLSIYQSASAYGSVSGLQPEGIANPDYRWEINKKTELALETGFLKNRILFTAAWYKNRSSNQLVGYGVPSITGFGSYQANLPALVENTGWELELHSVNIKSNHFSWSTSINLTLPQNELLSFPGLISSSYANQYVVGQPLSIVQGFQFTGVDPSNGLATFNDINKDGVLTPLSSYNNQGGDYIKIGKTAPSLFGGFGNTLNYHSIQLDIFISFVQQQGFNIYSYYALTGRLYNVWKDYLGYWKQSGNQNALPKPTADYGNTALLNSDFSSSGAAFTNASFIRLKNISLSYFLPDVWLSRMKISSCHIYLRGENLITISGFKGYDPETAGNPVLIMPPLKQISLGIQCSF